MVLTLDLPTSNSLVTDLILGWHGLLSVVYPSAWKVRVISSQKAANAGFLAWKWWHHSWSLIKRYKQEPLKQNSSKKNWEWICKGFIYPLVWSVALWDWWRAGRCGIVQVATVPPPPPPTKGPCAGGAAGASMDTSGSTWNVWGGLRGRFGGLPTDGVAPRRWG